MKAVSYIRCSTQNSEDSPVTQTNNVNAWCEREGHEVIKEYLDYGVSGGLPLLQRPAASLMISEARAIGAEAIVCVSVDRLSRDLVDLVGFMDSISKKKLQVLFVTQNYADDATGRLMLQIVGAFAEYYRRDIGEKIRRHHSDHARQGLWAGGYAPLGYHWDTESKTLSVDESRAGDALAVFQAFIESNGSATAATRLLNGQGVVTLKGNRWTATQLIRIITNPVYARCVHFGDVITPTELIPELVPQDVVMQAVTLSAHLGKTPRMKKYDFAYSRLVACSRCGRNFFRRVRDKDTLAGTWACCGFWQGQCDAPQIGGNRFDLMVREAVAHILEHIKEALPEYSRKKKPKRIQPVNLEARRKRVIDLYEEGLIDKEDMLTRLNNLQPQPEAEAEESQELPASVVQATAGSIRDLWGAMTEAEKRGFVMMLTKDMRLTSGNPALLEVETPYVSYTVRVLSLPKARVWLE
jgi:site-specific DNA recombinase